MLKEKDETYLMAPKINPMNLWNLTPEDFNEWRRKHDFPRIVKYCKSKLNCFLKWKKMYKIKDSDLIHFGPAIFLKPNKEIFLVKSKNNEDIIINSIELNKPFIGKKVGDKKVITSRRIIPYLTWTKKNKIKICPKLNDNTSVLIMGNFELINLGNCLLKNVNLSGRMLEFTNLDNLIIDNAYNNTELKLWYCKMCYLQISNEHLAFFNFFQTFLTGMNIINCALQDFIFQNSSLFMGSIENSTLHNCKFNSCFKPVLTNTKLYNCDFEIKYGRLSSIQDNYNFIKKIYASQGNYKEEKKYHYLEKKVELRRLFNPFTYYKSLDVRHRNTTLKSIILSFKEKEINFIEAIIEILKRIINLGGNVVKLLSSFFQYFFWGYGEKPIRILFFSFIIIFIFSLIYLNLEEIDHSIIASILYSIKSFLPLASWDGTQNISLKLIIAIESLIGTICLGFLIAGFSRR